MNNFVIIILIILIIFLFSGDKFLIDKLISNKMIILVSFIYLTYNNINLLFLLLSLIGIILSNENIRNILIEKYQDNIKQLKKYIFNFFNNIYKEGNSENAVEQLNQILEEEAKSIISPENLMNVDIDYTKEDINTTNPQSSNNLSKEKETEDKYIEGRNAGENIVENIEKDNEETEEIQKLLNEIKI